MSNTEMTTPVYRCGSPALQTFLSMNGYETRPIPNAYGKDFPNWAVPLNQEGAAICILHWLEANGKLRDNTRAFLTHIIEEQAADE